MNRLRKTKVFAWLSLFSLTLQILNGVFLYVPVLAQEIPTPTPTIEASPTPSPTEAPVVLLTPTPEPTISPEPTPTPTPEVSLTPEPSVEPTTSPDLSPSPTPEETIAPEASVSPSNQPEAPPSENNSNVAGEQTQASPEPGVSPSTSPTPEPEKENGHLSAAILKDTKADSINALDLDFQLEGSAVIKTDKLDYAPTDTVLVTGTGFLPDKTYTIEITSQDPPAVDFKAEVKTDDKGNLFYSYQLDGNYRPNYKVEIKRGDTVVAVTTFTDSLKKDFSQCANDDSPTPAGQCHWIGSALQGSNSNYVEGMSVPQRIIFTGITATSGNIHTLTFAHQATKGGSHAYDFLTAYNQGNNPALTLNQCNNLGALSSACDTLHGSSNTALVDVPDDPFVSKDGSTQTRINAYEAAFGDRQIKIYTNSPISAASFSSIAHTVADGADTGDSFIAYTLTWTSSSPDILIEMAGHVAVGGNGTGYTWGSGLGAASVSGGPYHIKLDQLDGSAIGSQDNQIQTGAILLPGTIIVTKNTVGGNGTFNYSTTGGSILPASFSITTVSDTGSQTFNNINPGVYTITESDPGSNQFNLTGLTCNDPTGNSAVNLGLREATINLATGELVTCTFTNTRSQGTIELKKAWSGTAGQTTLNIGTSAGGGQIASQLTGAGGAAPLTTGTKTVDTGTYYVSETGGLIDYTSALACTDNGQTVTPGAGNSLSVVTGHTVICTFTNTRKTGTVIVKKVMVGGTDTFSYTGNPSGSISTNNGTIQQTVDTGQYTSTEGAKSGWNLTSIVCDDNNSTGNTSTRTATFNVEANETVTCTFTNTKIPTLTVNKTLIPSSDSGLFNLQIDGATAGTGANVGDLGTTGAVEVTIGSHTVGETAGTLTSLSDYTSVISGDCGRDGSVALAAGENKTCTITNTRKPKLTVIKVTDPANDTGKFNLFVNSTQYATDVSNGGTTGAQYANIGANTFAENGGTGTNLSDYTSVVSGTGCSGSATAGTITLAAGDNKTCTITNTRKGSITIKKVTVGGDDSFTFTGDVAGSLSNNQTATSQVVAGTYHSTETGLAGWDLTEILCGDSDSSGVIGTGIATFNVASGENVTCTFTNTKRGHIIVNKVTNPSRDPQSFDFNASGGNYSNFSLTDQATPNDQELVPGVYGVSETGLSGWDLVNTECVSSRGDTEVASNLNLDPGETITCTFTNTKKGSITACKYNDVNGNGVIDQGDDQLLDGWEMTLNPGNVKQSTVNGCTTFDNLSPDNYSVTETLKNDWSNTSGGLTQNVNLGAGGNPTVNFLNFQCATISGTKWEDTNGNGQRDINEVGLPNWTINLDKATNHEGSTTTGSDGSYSFKVCQQGLYTVSETNPDTNVWYQTYPGGVAPVHLVDVTSGGNYSSKDFGNARYAKISGIKYRDNDGDGVLDANDLTDTLAGWVIDLFDGVSNNYITSYTTLVNGYYEFTGLWAGTSYYVLEQLLPGWTQTYGPVPTPTPVAVLSGDTKEINFANFENISIKACKEADPDGDFETTEGRTPVSGWSVNLIKNGQTLDTQSTGQDGCHTWDNLGPGSYGVSEETRNDWKNLTPINHNFGVVTSGDDLSFTFVNTQLGKAIVKKVMTGGTDSFDFTGNVSGTINVNNGTIEEGYLPPGEYTSVESVKSGWDLTGISCDDENSSGDTGTRTATFNIEANETVTCTFTNTKKGHIIVDKITNPGQDPESFTFNTTGTGYSGFSLTDASTPNDQELAPGRYTVAESVPDGWNLTNTSCISSIQDTETANSLELDAGETIICTFTDTKHGRFIVHKETDPASDITTEFTVTASTGNGAILSTPTQNVTGGGFIDYEVMPGVYSATESNLPLGWQQYLNSCTDIVIPAGGSHTCYIHNTKLGSISGYKYDATSNLGLLGWTIYLYNTNSQATSSTITDSQGYYSFLDLWPSLYTFSEHLETGWTPISSPAPVTLTAGQNSTGNNFVNFKNISISGQKFNDLDGDGIKDDGEPGLEGWTINLDKDADGNIDQTTTTDVSGNYSFAVLGPGTYRVREGGQTNWIQTTTNPADITVVSGQNVSGVDFGNFREGHISGHKWNDLNGDGIWNNGEPALSGWKIYLDRPAGDDIYRTTETDGSYYFGDLGPGQYRVYELLSENPGWVQTAPNGNEYIINMTSNAIGLNNPHYDLGNQGRGTITVNKNVDTNGDGQVEVTGATDWTWDITNGDQDIPTGGQGKPLAAGTYTISEDQKDNYHVTSLFCTGDEVSRGAVESTRITLNPGADIICTFTNTRDTGSLRADKEIDTNGDLIYEEGNVFAESLGFKWGTESGSINYAMGDGVGDFPTGSYNVYETENIPGYHFVGWFEGEGVCEESELSTSLPAQVTVNKDLTTVVTFCNVRDTGTIIVRKITDPHETEETFDIDLTQEQEGFIHRYTLGSGGSESFDTLTGQYMLNEQPTVGWDLTSAVCTSDQTEREITGFDPRQGFTLNPGETIDCTFTNTIKNPILTITKKNDATGDKVPGDSVLFTLTITATQSAVRNVFVYDLPAEGFHYRHGSWTAVSDKNSGLVVGEPTYASPGKWSLGNMQKGETITLTYLADIDGAQQPGLYKDLAWARGASLCSGATVVLAVANDPGYVDTNFVGTQVNVVKEQQYGDSFNAGHEEKVLGASTSLPATGADSFWFILALSMLIIGAFSIGTGVYLKRKYD